MSEDRVTKDIANGLYAWQANAENMRENVKRAETNLEQYRERLREAEAAFAEYRAELETRLTARGESLAMA